MSGHALAKWAVTMYRNGRSRWAEIRNESRIRGQALQNIVHLERYERMDFDSEDVELVINTLREMEIAPVHYLLARHFNGIYRSMGISLLWHLVATHRLDCDIREPLNENLELWVAVP